MEKDKSRIFKYIVMVMLLIVSIKDLPRELIREIYSYLDFNYNTYVITTGKRNRKLILIQKPICDAIDKLFEPWGRRGTELPADDEIFFISK